jgi:hypothetical protein
MFTWHIAAGSTPDSLNLVMQRINSELLPDLLRPVKTLIKGRPSHGINRSS